MKKIQLTQGQVALVDDKNFEWLNQWRWYVQKDRARFYVRRMSSTINGERHMISMHHEVIGKPPKGFETDHRNGNGLDNQKNNLRHVTKRQNQQNQRNRKQKTSSRYPGVCWYKLNKKWQATIQTNNKQTHLGFFANELEAFNAYKQAVNVIGEKIIE